MDWACSFLKNVNWEDIIPLKFMKEQNTSANMSENTIRNWHFLINNLSILFCWIFVMCLNKLSLNTALNILAG